MRDLLNLSPSLYQINIPPEPPRAPSRVRVDILLYAFTQSAIAIDESRMYRRKAAERVLFVKIIPVVRDAVGGGHVIA